MFLLSSLLGAALALAPAAPTDGAGPLVGEPLPDLPLSHALQGDAWTQQDLLGTIVVLDVFQLG